jgi:anti-anti-sigma factor
MIRAFTTEEVRIKPELRSSMEITKRQVGDILELKIHGRVDSYWADHLGAAVDQEIRQGFHQIRLDLSPVAFLSSAGIGTLVRLYRDLKSIQGSFAVSNWSPVVLKVIQLSKLEDLLLAKTPSLASSVGPSAVEPPVKATKLDRAEATYEIYALAADAQLQGQLLGDASLLKSSGFDKEHCQTLQFPNSSFAIGLGALGSDFEDCKSRFGEFIAAAGAVAYLPTDGTNVPDFLLADDGSGAEVQVCYGLACHGKGKQPFRSLVRFEGKAGVPVPLSALLESCLEFTKAERIGVVMIAESAGLVGAALRKSPIPGTGVQNAFDFPQIRDWLSFTAEPAYSHRIGLLAGVAVRGTSGALAPILQPFSTVPDFPLSAHFHAAAFSYRPVQKGPIDLNASIKALFENQSLEGIIHLLTDDRDASGTKETELHRGACWIAPMTTTLSEGASS